MDRRFFDRRFFTWASGGVLAGLAEMFAVSAARAAPATKAHRVVFQISGADAGQMNLVLNNAANFAEYYKTKGEDAQVEIVAFGPGYAMLRDTSPVKARIADMRKSLPTIAFSACQNSRRALAHAEGKTPEAITELPDVTDVPAGVVRISELQEMGWTYLRP